jgi:hypothetical protein
MSRLLNLAFLLPLLVLLAVGFALWGWAAQARALGFTTLDVLYNALHAVTLSTLYGRSNLYNHDWRIDVARVLGTLAFLIAATQAVLKLLSAHASRYFGRFRKSHLLVVGDHPVARGVVQAAARRRKRVTWITNAEVDEAAIPGALIVPELWDGRFTQAYNAPGADNCVVAFGNEVQQVAAVRMLRAAAPRLPITMNFGDAWFAERMDEMENITAVRFVSQVQLSVRDLHWRNPPFLIARDLGHRRLHALLIGLGRGGEAVLTDLLLCSLTSYLGKPKVTIVDPRAAEIARSLQQRCPALADSVDIAIIDPGELFDVRVLPMEELAAAQQADPFTVGYVSVNEDIRAMAIAVSLQAAARREGWRMGPIFTRLVHGGALPDTVQPDETAGLVLFGATQDFAAAIGLFDPDIDRMPRMFHEAYRRTARPDTPANRPWDDLAEEFRESNRRLVVHLPAKLASAGVDVSALLQKVGPADPPPRVPLPDLQGNPELMETLAELEHRRWAMDRHLSGWRPGPLRDNARRIHPNLKPYAELDEYTRELDRAIVREAWAALGSSAGSGFFPDRGGMARPPLADAAE